MTNLLLINKGSLRVIGLALLLLVGCETPTEPENLHGCLDSQACNYNSNATIDNNSCWYADDGCLCSDGQNAIPDECGVCDLDTTNDCLEDECGVYGGDGVDSDEDGVCDDADDCVGVYDDCGECNGSNICCGDYYYDYHGDGINYIGEPGEMIICPDNGIVDCTPGELIYNPDSFGDYGIDGFPYYSDLDTGNGHQAVFRYADSDGQIINWLLFDNNGDPIWLYGPDYGEGDGIFQPGDTWNDNGDWIADPTEAGWSITDMFTLSQHIIGEDDDGNGIIDDCYTIDEPIIIDNIILNCWIDPNTNEIVIIEVSSNPNFYAGFQNQDFIFNQIEVSTYIFFDVWPPPDGLFTSLDVIADCGADGYCWDFTLDNQESPQHAKDIWNNYLYDEYGNSIIITGPDCGEGDGFLNPFHD